MRAVNRFLNPVMKVMCTTSHTSQRDPAGEPNPVRAEDRAAAVHGGHAPEVPVLPGGWLGAISHTISDDMSSMEPRLERDLGYTWEVVEVHHVADYEHLRVAGQ